MLEVRKFSGEITQRDIEAVQDLMDQEGIQGILHNEGECMRLETSWKQDESRIEDILDVSGYLVEQA